MNIRPTLLAADTFLLLCPRRGHLAMKQVKPWSCFISCPTRNPLISAGDTTSSSSTLTDLKNLRCCSTGKSNRERKQDLVLAMRDITDPGSCCFGLTLVTGLARPIREQFRHDDSRCMLIIFASLRWMAKIPKDLGTVVLCMRFLWSTCFISLRVCWEVGPRWAKHLLTLLSLSWKSCSFSKIRLFCETSSQTFLFICSARKYCKRRITLIAVTARYCFCHFCKVCSLTWPDLVSTCMSLFFSNKLWLTHTQTTLSVNSEYVGWAHHSKTSTSACFSTPCRLL